MLAALKKELELCFGRRIMSYRDCIQLVEDLQQKTGYTVNVNTLRRFFGLVSTPYTASSSTITILCKYCGLNSIDDLVRLPDQQTGEENINSKEILQYFNLVFKSLPLGAEHVAAVSAVLEQTIIFLERNPHWIESFQREAARLPAGQYYYFEQCCNTDRLNDYFGQGLAHYLRNKGTNEAAAFYYSMQLFANWLSERSEHTDKYAQALENTQLPAELSPAQAYKTAARIFYQQMKKSGTEDAVADALKFYQQYGESRRTAPFTPDFELIACEALLLTGQQTEAKYFFDAIRQNSRARVNNLSPARRSLFAVLADYYDKDDIMFLAASPEKQHPAISATRFNRKYLALLHSLLHKKRDQKLTRQLIKETGFVKFYALYKEYEIT